MGFFGGLITFQAVIVLIFTFAAVGFLAGVALVAKALEEACPEAIETINRKAKEKREARNGRNHDP